MKARTGMGSNREQRDRLKGVHVLLALFREGTNQDHRCIRQVIRDYETDLKFLEMRCLARGGEWRIHQTVNMRDTEKAMKHLIKKLIDHPELCTDVDLEWRTSLLQPDCIYGEKKFMLDVDTKDVEPILKLVGDNLIQKIESPKGWHLITKAFDAREVCLMQDVSLQRDGYFYVKTVKEASDGKGR